VGCGIPLIFKIPPIFWIPSNLENSLKFGTDGAKFVPLILTPAFFWGRDSKNILGLKLLVCYLTFAVSHSSQF